MLDESLDRDPLELHRSLQRDKIAFSLTLMLFRTSIDPLEHRICNEWSAAIKPRKLAGIPVRLAPMSKGQNLFWEEVLESRCFPFLNTFFADIQWNLDEKPWFLHAKALHVDLLMCVFLARGRKTRERQFCLVSVLLRLMRRDWLEVA